MKSFLIALLITTSMAQSAFALTLDDAKDAVGQPEVNNPDLELGSKTGSEKLTDFVMTILNTSIFAGLIGFLTYFVYGGLRWLMAGGDPKAVQAAQHTITNAFIGIILLSIGYAMWWIMQQFIGTAPPGSLGGPPGPT